MKHNQTQTQTVSTDKSIKFSDLNLPNMAPTDKTIKFGNYEIKIKQHLPIFDKYNLIMITLQQAEEGRVYSEIKLDMYFALNIIFKYADIEFSAEDRVNADLTYDKLNTSGLMAAILEAVPDSEMDSLTEFLEKEKETRLKYGNNPIAAIKSLFTFNPATADKMKEMLESFDMEKYQEVMNFVNAINGNKSENSEVTDNIKPIAPIGQN